ncbi:MAG TPA: rhodanese-like domain-containing protein [Bdellovibrionota bacterium]|nr:rhodanese-like domain-containing protein [Bdellovibrionota bacterium]
MKEITATELKQRLDKGEPLVLLDVREQNEYDHCRIPGAKLIPLRQIPGRTGGIDAWSADVDPAIPRY